MQKILIIQTAFIGDVVLATALVEKILEALPGASIDFLVRKGNESLLENNPGIRQVLIWNKKQSKTRHLFTLLSLIRNEQYEKVINLQRYFSTGMLTAFSGAKETIGFNKNPLSFLFSKKIPHDFDIDHPRHEIEKNNGLVQHFTNEKIFRPALYPSASDYDTIQPYTGSKYVTMTPSSVWFTKQYPAAKWIDLIKAIPAHVNIYLLGGKENIGDCDQIIQKSAHTSISNLAGKLSFLQSAALMETAAMNYVNDSAPLHFASAMNAPVTAIFCSTIPGFGYTPLSDISHIVETSEKLPCRPCGLHGKKACPEGHFKCGFTIKNEQLLEKLVL